MSESVACLDKGLVNLVDWMGDDLSVVRAARVIADAEWRDAGDPKLLRYMLRNHHSTPFEHVTFTFYVKAPIFVFRQWHRHRTWSFNEISARYKELPEDFYVPDAAMIGNQSLTNHQGRDLTLPVSSGKEHEVSAYRIQCEDSFSTYRGLLRGGWPRELARCVLPLATYSEMFATVNLWNLLRFVGLRSDEHAQYEIRVYSDAMLNLIEPIVPVSVAAWREMR